MNIQSLRRVRTATAPGRRAAARKRAARPRAARSIRAPKRKLRRCSATARASRDLLIEHLHLIQDKYGHISAAHLAALAAEMKLSQTEVYEVATFYAHFDVVKEGETPPPPVTVRVCDSLSCAMAGADRLLNDLPKLARARACASFARRAWARAIARRSAPSATCR